LNRLNPIVNIFVDNFGGYGYVWFEAICQTLGRDIAQDERAHVPPLRD